MSVSIGLSQSVMWIDSWVLESAGYRGKLLGVLAMIIAVGEKLHIMYRSIYEKSIRRHFVGEVVAVHNSLCRIKGYVFIYDERLTEFHRKQGERITFIDIAESGFITNLIDSDVVIDEIRYSYLQNIGLVATDGKDFVLNINEFGPKS